MAELIVSKRAKNAILYEGGLVKLEGVRASYPHLAKPYAGKGNGDDGKPQQAKYGIVGMLPKQTHVEAKDLLKGRIEALLRENDNAQVAKDKWCLKNGDDSDKEIYRGFWTVSARESRRPGIRDVRGNLVSDPTEIADLIVGGYWVNILIRLWYQDGKKVGAGYGKRVNAGLVGVQFVRKDETFGEGRIDDSEAWGDESGSSGDGDGFSGDDDI